MSLVILRETGLTAIDDYLITAHEPHPFRAYEVALRLPKPTDVATPGTDSTHVRWQADPD